MSARAQHCSMTATSPTLSHPCECSLSSARSPSAQSPPLIVPGGQAYARTFPVIAAANGQFTSYPPPYSKQDDEQLLYTHAAFHEEPIAAFSINKLRDDTWTLCVPVPIPKVHNPTLLALNYMIKYASTYDNGSSTIQTDTILTTKKLPEVVVTEHTDLGIYHRDDFKDEVITVHNVHRSDTGFAPRLIDQKQALCLSTTLAIKCNGAGGQWSHYVDNQHITPNVRVVKDSHLYVVFRTNEYPTIQTSRSLSVKVSATWQKEEVEKKAIAEAARKAKEEADRQVQLEAERRAREAEERQARIEEKQAREEERKAREDAKLLWEEIRKAQEEERKAREEQRQAREEERKAREEEKKAREEERQAREEDRKAREEERQAREKERHSKEEEHSTINITAAAAPATADKNMQVHIKDRMEKLGLAACPSGYEFKKTNEGYQCTGGGHKITFEQLGMKM